MNDIHHFARRDASGKHPSRKGRGAAVKIQTRRRLFAERLEDRSLMAADVFAQAQDGSALNLLNAEGEAGSTLPNKVSYTLQILDTNGNPLTTADNRTATLPKDTDFYLQLVGQDIRPAGVDPLNGKKLARGVFSAFTDILYDKSFATIAANETQSIAFTSANQTGTFTLTLPTNASGKSGTTAPINFDQADGTGTAKNITDALNTTLFGSTTANGVKVVYDTNSFRFNVTFVGINNVSLPLMTSDDGGLTIAEVLDGAASDTLAAVQYELNGSGAVRYDVAHSAAEASFGIDDVGAFTSSRSPLGTDALPVLRIHMVATSPTTTPASVVFTPDPLGDGSGSPDDMKRPDDNTLVYGNDNILDSALAGTVSDATPTANRFNAASATALSSVDGAYYGKNLTFTSGPLAGQTRMITDYVGSTKTFVFATGFSQSPQNGAAWTIQAEPSEAEKSLVAFGPTNNEFLNLTGVTLSISSPLYTAVPDTGFSVNENHTAGVNSVSIPVLANDTITGVPGTPIKEIKSFDATTTGGTITKDGDNLVFTPDVDFTGTATFTYTGGPVGDNSLTATGTVTVSVAAVNRAPTCNFGPAQSTNDEQGLQTVTGWMTGCSANDPQQTVSFTVSTDNPDLFTVVPTVDANGKLSFDPAPNVEGTADVTVTIKDDGGTANGGVDQTKVDLQFNVVKLHPFFNAADTGARRGLDVTGSTSSAPDGHIVADDVLAIINYINAKGSKIPDNPPEGGPYVDVNGDGRVVAEDVLIVINYINAHPHQSEGESYDASPMSEPSSTTSADDLLFLLATDLVSQPKRTLRG
ncbi:MAG TPA: dockerin type I domain-containing protein [Pirellulaceae bacterium]